MTHDNKDAHMTLSFRDYEEAAAKTAVYPFEYRLLYPVLGLNGEAGEVAEKVKKIVRDNKGVVEQHHADDLQKEVGDVLWYLAAVCHDLGITLEGAAQANIEKLRSRQERGVIGGSGDDR